MSIRHTLMCGLCAALILFCSEPTGPGTRTSTGEQESFGVFLVQISPPEGKAQMSGVMYEGPYPSKVVWETEDSSGECRLRIPRTPFCPEGCGSNALCVEDDSCMPTPKKISVGTVTVNGLKTNTGVTTFTMDHIGFNYQPVGLKLSYPPCADGDPVSITASGDSVTAPFTLTTIGIDPLQVLNDSIWLIDGQPIDLRWTPPANKDNSTVFVMIDISYHGNTKGKIECFCEDDGQLTVPVPMLSRLIALGISGFPKIEVSRLSVGGTDSASKGKLVIESKLLIYLHIPGIYSCDGERIRCPDGMTCGDDRRCR